MNTDLIKRIDEFLPSIKPGLIIKVGTYQLLKDLGYPVKARSCPTSNEAREFLEKKREELNG